MLMKLGSFLKEKREAAGISQAKVAKKLKYTTPQFISNWERGVSSPPVKVLKILSDMYGVSTDELFELVLEHSLEQLKKNMIHEYKNMSRRKKKS